MRLLVATQEPLIPRFVTALLSGSREIQVTCVRGPAELPRDLVPFTLLLAESDFLGIGDLSELMARPEVAGMIVLAAPVLDVPTALASRIRFLQMPLMAEAVKTAVRGFQELAKHQMPKPTAEGMAKSPNSAPTVLVAEDSALQRQLVVSTFKSEGFRVLQAPNGKAALDILRVQPVDMVVTDVEMPEMTGLELTRAIRSDPRLAGLPVLVTTTLSGFDQVRQGFDAGASDYVVKPHKGERELFLDELVRRVYGLLEQASVIAHRRALVVDDSHLARQMIARVLTDHGYEVDTAEDGEQARQFLDNENIPLPDVLVTDLEMPVLDGLHLTHLVKQNPRTRDMPVVILSASTSREHRVLGRGFGADAFLTKPPTDEKLITTVEQVRHRTRLAKEHRELSRILGRDVFKAVHSGGLTARKQTATIIFTDISGFSTLCTQLSAVEVVDLLNDYFDGLVDCISLEQGYVNKFIGDAIMAVFSEQTGLASPPVRAVRAAIAMQKENRRRSLNRSHALETRIGVNTGEIILGLIGSGERKDYTVIGDAVNRAQRFESKAPVGGILVSHETYCSVAEMVAQMPDVNVELITDLRLKGISEPVTAYSLTIKE